MIPCNFILTPYKSRDGRPVSRCSRAGCSEVLFNHPALCVATCRAPQFNGGEMVANLAKRFGIQEKPGCGCRPRRKRWNRKYSFALPSLVYHGLVAWRRLVAWWRVEPYEPPVERIERLLAIGTIR